MKERKGFVHFLFEFHFKFFAHSLELISWLPSCTFSIEKKLRTMVMARFQYQRTSVTRFGEKNRHLGKLWQSFLSEWKNIETTFLANLLYFRANFCRCKWQKMNKSRVHLVTLPEDPGYSLDIVNFYLNKTEWSIHSFQTSTQLYNK